MMRLFPLLLLVVSVAGCAGGVFAPSPNESATFQKFGSPRELIEAVASEDLDWEGPGRTSSSYMSMPGSGKWSRSITFHLTGTDEQVEAFLAALRAKVRTEIDTSGGTVDEENEPTGPLDNDMQFTYTNGEHSGKVNIKYVPPEPVAEGTRENKGALTFEIEEEFPGGRVANP